MFVSAANFDKRPYQIPNLSEEANGFLEYVEDLEKEALLGLLGRQLYKAFIEGLEALPDEWDENLETVINQEYVYQNSIWKALTVSTGETPVAGADWELVEANNKWLKLKNGAEYEYQDKTWKWEGVLDLLIPYVYSAYVRDNADSFTGNGMVVAANENSEFVTNAVRVTNSFNDFASKVGVVDDYCVSHRDSLYGFLYSAEEGTYEDWTFKNPGLLNTFNF